MKIGKVINYNIKIEPMDNFGFFANVGCGHFVFTDIDSLVAGLSDYLHDPEKYEKEYAAINDPTAEGPQLTTAISDDQSNTERER